MPFQAFTHLNSLDLPPSLSLSLPLSPSFLALFFEVLLRDGISLLREV